jgi:hypothetical protein
MAGSLSLQSSFDCCAIKSRMPDDNKACLTWRAAEGLVEVVINAWSDRLHCEAHGFAGYCHEAFEAQDAVVGDDV